MMPPPDLSKLSEAEKDCLILNLWPLAERVQELMRLVEALQARIAALEAQLGEPPKTSDNSSQPPSSDRKADRPAKGERTGPRAGSVGRKGGGRLLCAEPDEIIVAKARACAHCGTGLGEADQVRHGRYDKIELPPVRPVVTRVERFAGHCPCCGGVTLAPVPEGLEEGSPFGVSILAVALYLRFVHAISYKRLSGLFAHLFALEISEGALDSLFQGARSRLDAEVAAILTRLRRARVIGSDETTVRVEGRTCWNWVFQNAEVVIHVIRPSRASGVVEEVLDGHRPQIWVSDLYSAQIGHAEEWQVCLAHQVRDLQYAIEAGDTVFAPRMKRLLLRAVAYNRRRTVLSKATRREYRRRLERDLDPILASAPTNPHGKRLRKRYLKYRDNLFTFLTYPEAPADNNGSERDLRPMALYRKVTGGFRSTWGADLCAAAKSVIGTAQRQGIDAYQALLMVLSGRSLFQTG
jgi:transposase